MIWQRGGGWEGGGGGIMGIFETCSTFCKVKPNCQPIVSLEKKRGRRGRAVKDYSPLLGVWLEFGHGRMEDGPNICQHLSCGFVGHSAPPIAEARQQCCSDLPQQAFRSPP